MNFGEDNLRYEIRDYCNNHGVKITVPGGAGKFYKDLGKHLYKYIEENGGDVRKGMKEQAMMNGISKEVIKYTDRICKVFSFSVVQLDPIAISVYEWMLEQEAKGQTVEKFAKWALDPERVKFVNKYRNNAGNFKNDWVLAFTGQQTAILRNEDGSLNV